MTRANAGIAALVVMSGCAVVPQGGRPVVSPKSASSVPAPATVPPPTPAPVSTPPVPIRRTFRFPARDDTDFVQGGMVIGEAPSGTTALDFDGASIPVADDGTFLIAFDRDHGPSASLVATLSDGTKVSDALTIAKRDWHIQRLHHLRKVSVPSEAFKRIRAGELAQIHAARAMRTGSQGWRQDFLWPVTGRISDAFGAQRYYDGVPGAYHSGIDVAVPVGTPVRAPADGVVILASDHPFTLEGNLLMVDHGMGLNSAFLHLSKIEVQTGDHVKRGEVIALSGDTGHVTGPHLHWSLKWDASRIDPLLVAGPMPN